MLNVQPGPRDRRLLSTLLILGVVAVAFFIVSQLTDLFFYFGDIFLTFFLAWLLAFIISPIVARIVGHHPAPAARGGDDPRLRRGRRRSWSCWSSSPPARWPPRSRTSPLQLPNIKENLPEILAPWQAWLDSIGLGQIDLVAQAEAALANLDEIAAALVEPLQQIAVASLSVVGTMLIVFFLSIYMVLDRDAVLAFLFRIVPPTYSEEARLLETSVSRSFGGFLRGQALMGFVYFLIALGTNLLLGLPLAALTSVASGFLQMIPFFGPFISWAPPVIVALVLKPDAVVPTIILMGAGWIVVMNVLQPRIMQGAVGIHPIVVLGSVLIGGRIAGIPGAIFGIPIAAVVSAFFLEFLQRTSGDRSVAGRAARRLEERDGRPVRIPREPTPGSAADIDDQPPGHRTRTRTPSRHERRRAGRRAGGSKEDEAPDMTRERARTERRDIDKEQGEPVAGASARRGPAGAAGPRRPGDVGESSHRPRILVTNDDGVESRGLLALKQALEGIGEITVVAPDTNQSAVGHQKTLMRPLRVRERILADGSLAYSVDGSPTDAVSLAFLGYFGHGFDLVAAGINYGANLGDDITYSGTVSAAMEAVINNCPAFAISQEYYAHPDFSLAGRAATAVARNILEHGLAAGELVNVNVPAVPLERVRRRRGDPPRQARLPGPAHRAPGSARHPLLLDRRTAAVGAGRRGHRLPCRRQPADRRDADPSRPDRAAAAAPSPDLGLDAARGTQAAD